jgi:hypothetical protein
VRAIRAGFPVVALVLACDVTLLTFSAHQEKRGVAMHPLLRHIVLIFRMTPRTVEDVQVKVASHVQKA